jgi:Arylsulfatase regulator (Fe-S oxidoreductase)
MIDRACISISGRCNMQCLYCHFRNKSNEYDDLSLPDAIEIIDKMSDYINQNKISTFKIGLVGAGEALFQFPLIKEIVEYANKQSDAFSFYTITNGININEEILEYFYSEKNKIHLNFSLDGNQEIHDMYRIKNGTGTFEAVFKSIKNYEKIFGKKPEINCTVHKTTLEKKNELFQFLKKERFENVCFSKIVNVEGMELEIKNEKFYQFLQDAKINGISTRQHRVINSADCIMYGKKCGVGINNIFYSDGKIYPCGRFAKMEKYVIGKYGDSLEEIERKMKQFTPVEEGQCYYDLNAPPQSKIKFQTEQRIEGMRMEEMK